MTLADQDVRDRILNELDTTLVIEAAAGTGKTTALTSRIVSVLAAGRTTLDRIVAVTFTDKAAGELRLRVREEIERARAEASPELRARLETSLPHLEQARIGTIHSFCGDLLHERPVEARVDPRFEVAPGDSAATLLAQAFDRWFESTLDDPGPGLRRILCRPHEKNNGPRENLRKAAADLCEWRDFPASWRREAFERDREIDSLIAEFERVGALAAVGDDTDFLTRSLQHIQRFVTEATRLEGERLRDYDVLEAQLCGVLKAFPRNHWNWKGRGSAGFAEVSHDQALALRDALRERVERFSAAAEADLAAFLRDELWPVIKQYERLKRRAGVLDFMDLLVTVRDMLRANRAVREELQSRFTHIFIDEFQDTDPLQAEILMLLAADDPAQTDWTRVRPRPGKIFIVGDPKQSIYRFRRADVALYQRVKRQLVERGAALENLTVSFRSVPRIQELVNAAFAPVMDESPTQAGYAPLARSRPDDSAQPAVVALPVPAPYKDWGDNARITKQQLDQSLPDAVGAFVKWLVAESGWRVTDRDCADAPRPVASRDICILFRRLIAFRRDVTRDYVRALEARSIAHVLVGGSSFHEREEVMAVRAALAAIERPDDELSVFATLRGPMFALSDAALLVYRESGGSLNPFGKPPAAIGAEPANDASKALREVADPLDVLRRLHRGRNRRPIADTIARLLDATRAHAGFAMWPTGEQALANLARLMDEARRFEARREGVSFRAFVQMLEERAERGDRGEAVIAEQGTDGVRLLTVHGAKGLEFPIVILADITRNETAAEAQRFVDPLRGLCAMQLAGCSPAELNEHNQDELRRDSEEAARLLYVAATRARDLLVVPVVGDEPQTGWLAALNPVLYPQEPARRAPASSHPPGCPPFGDDSVAERPPRAPSKGRAVAPGLHQTGGGKCEVVWWDPHRLTLNVRESMGLRQDKLLRADESGHTSRLLIDEHHQWRSARAAMLAAGASPSIRVVTATELAHAPLAPNGDRQRPSVRPPSLSDLLARVSIVEVAREAGRPHGPRFGTLLHVVLLNAAFDADRSTLMRLATFHARLIGANADEAAAACEAAARALASPPMRRAAAAREVRREAPLLVKLDDGAIVEGVADLAYAAGVQDGWTVIDFKTDIELAPRIEEYRTQLALYMHAVALSTSAAVEGILLWT